MIGETATLSWSVSNATKVEIDQGIGVVEASGSRQVAPTSNTTYTLTATNNDGSVTKSAAIEVTGATLSDIVGTWTGKSYNSSVTFNWTSFKVDSSGKMEATSSTATAGATLSVEISGKVTGSGVVGIITGGTLIVAWGTWTLQLSSNKKKLEGKFSVSYSGFSNMTTELNKQ